ncbi:hypothetical protein CDAR_235701 [Caerostris darwini]|uniref:Uncharacterized protein n=1 Tax=Caerostris darwini TaxID=1538125 RepID=A0AAV4UDQ0_9ARAC|nr:hypothetical protein CDAR_235701 [Caerostris darwini]
MSLESVTKKRKYTREVQPLQLMCLRETVILLFKRTDIKNFLHEFGCRFRRPHRHLECLEKRVKELASTLPIPARMKNTLLDMFLSMAIEVFDWYSKHGSLVPYDFDVLSSFHWRSDGTIDDLKTAQALVRRQDADANSRFRIAIGYNLTADIERIFEESANMSMRVLDLTNQLNNVINSLFARRHACSRRITCESCICGGEDPMRVTVKNGSFSDSSTSDSE